RIMEKLLVNDGYAVISSSSGKLGVQKAREEQPTLILVDAMIPDMSGAQVVRALRQEVETRTIPIIFITAIMGVENDKGDEEINVDGEYFRAFAKPLHNPKLLSVIRKEINKANN
ncbi:MAG: response regulator, partial [Candidatus Omnitrophica bacterium]|nr:response regulator [Candidatus Omnitrophota bacterium]